MSVHFICSLNAAAISKVSLLIMENQWQKIFNNKLNTVIQPAMYLQTLQPTGLNSI